MTASRKIIHQTLACSPVILNQMLIGVGWGWIAPTLAKLNDPQSPFGVLTIDQLSWLASINEVGRLLGPIVAPSLIDNIGRKYFLFLINTLYIVVWLSTIFAPNIHLLLVARILFGLANGMNDVLTGIYVSENCSPNLRGIIASVTVLNHFVGIFYALIIASNLSFTSTAIVNAATSACVFATLYFCTETPYFLIMKGKREQAEKNLIWLSGNISQQEVVNELGKIEESVSAEKLKTKSLKLLFFSSVNLRGILVVVGLHVLQMMTGAGVFLTYATLIFPPSGSVTSDQYTMMFSVAQMLAVALSPFIIERMSRRSLTIGTLAGSAVANGCSCVLVYLHNKGCEVAFYPWLIFTSVSLCGIFVALNNPAVNSIKGELLPLSVRAIGSSMAVTAHSITSFCVIKVFLPISAKYGMETNFIMYTAIGLVGIILIYYVLPETRGKTLYELQNMDKREGVLLEGNAGDKMERKYIFTS